MNNTMSPGRHGTKKSSGLIYTFLILTLLLLTVISILWGRYPISLNGFINWLKDFSAGTADKTFTHIILNIRLPRIAAAVIVGIALSVAGSAYQGVFNNPMVSPDILGASAGAGFGASLAIILGFPAYMIQLISFIFGLLTVIFSSLLSFLAVHRASKTLILLLSGMVVSALFNSFISIIKYVADPYSQLPEITYWLMGGLSNITPDRLKSTLIPFIVSLLIIMAIRWKINVLSLGEEEAMALGMNPKVIRAVIICCATLLTSLAISICGQISWIGLVVPHMTRMLTGPNYKRLLPATALLGGGFLLAADNIARNLTAVEIPLGILTSIFGAPIFVVLLLRGKRGWF